ncbi:SDR family NAD(P)-dependent oxidoreductase [Actinomadura sp. SCN-SB]|uniref:SDR family NAD(P)-dependent oxidoreductase n=1 Tax=Actinomadura sp. SCN-SB TaxID=3373092 RepID=UPI003752C577
MSEKKRSVIVTGGASGTGLASARMLGTDGWSVVLVDQDEERLARAADELRDTGADVT